MFFKLLGCMPSLLSLRSWSGTITGSGGIYGTGCHFEGGGVRVILGKIIKIRAFPHPVPYMPPDPNHFLPCFCHRLPNDKSAMLRVSY